MSIEPLIKLRRLAKDYESGAGVVRALRDVDLEIAQGEFVAIVGTSGSGKSTLMNILGCLDRPSHGAYELAGFDVGSRSSDARAVLRNRLIGFIFQGFNLLPRTTALENVELPLVYRGVTAKERRAMAMGALASVGLADRVHHTPNQLSGGQQQRVAIARALVTGPPMLLADEPTGNLDTRTSLEVLGLLQRLNQDRGITIVLVTHEHDIAACASRVVQFRDGNIVSDVRHEPLDAAAALAKLPPEVHGAGAREGAEDDPAAVARRRLGGPVPTSVYVATAVAGLLGLGLGKVYADLVLEQSALVFSLVFSLALEAAFAARWSVRALGRPLTTDQRARLALHYTLGASVAFAALTATGLPPWSAGVFARLDGLSIGGVASAVAAALLAMAALALARFLLVALALPLFAARTARVR
jgi:putative ABC transport system ATP-binding protein